MYKQDLQSFAGINGPQISRPKEGFKYRLFGSTGSLLLLPGETIAEGKDIAIFGEGCWHSSLSLVEKFLTQ